MKVRSEILKLRLDFQVASQKRERNETLNHSKMVAGGLSCETTASGLLESRDCSARTGS